MRALLDIPKNKERTTWFNPLSRTDPATPIDRSARRTLCSLSSFIALFSYILSIAASGVGRVGGDRNERQLMPRFFHAPRTPALRRRLPRSFTPDRLESRVLLSLAPAGPDIQFDPAATHTEAAEVSMDADGDFVATWEVFAGGEGPGATVYEWPEVQRYDRAGNAVGPVIRPDDLALRPGVVPPSGVTEHFGFLPTVATDDAGNFVVVWMASNGDPQTVMINVLARRYGADGQALGPAFRVDPPTSHIIGGYDSLSVAMNAGGQFVVAWLDQPGGSFAQRYDAAGQALGGPVLVDGPGGTTRTFTRVAMDDTGRFAVVWNETYGGLNAQSESVFVRHFGADGRPAGARRLVTTATGVGVSRIYSNVHMDADGDTLVNHSTTGIDGLLGQRYSATGEVVGGPLLLGPSGAGDVAMDADGDLIAFWGVEGPDGTFNGPSYLRQFTRDGQPSGEPVLVRSGANNAFRVAVDNDGSRALVAWGEPVPGSPFTAPIARPYVAGPDGGGGDSNKSPTTTGLADVAVDAGTVASVVPLKGSFADDRGANALTYSVRDNSNAALFSSVAANSATGMLTLMYAPGQSGEATLTIVATDASGLSVATPLNVTVRPAAPTPEPVPPAGGGDFTPLPAGTKVVTGRLFTRAPGHRRKVAAAGVAVFLDANGNGARDANEPVATSGADGVYAFSGLAAGRYQVRLADAAWQPATPAGKPPRPVIIPARRRKAVRARPMVLAPAP